MSEHATENFKQFTSIVGKEVMSELLAKMRKALKMDDDSVACVVNIAPTSNPFRDDWRLNDRIVAIIRQQTVCTVMLSRQAQITKSHLRTSRCI